MPLSMTHDVGVQTLQDGGYLSRSDTVAAEEPLEIRLHGEALAVVMRTPGHDMELAAGFLCAEEIIRSSDDLESIRHCTSADADEPENIVEVRLIGSVRESAEALLGQRRAERATVTSASCGVCGKRSIEALHSNAPPFERAPEIVADRILPLPDHLRAAQQVFDSTGGLHGAAVFDADGQLVVAREDVGRHNAVDKCVGFLMMRELLPLKGATLMVSGRTSFEIIQKALVARIQTVAAVSAPSSLAVQLANASNMGLVGFVRGGNLNVYAGELVGP